jgi:hypothetical protein
MIDPTIITGWFEIVKATNKSEPYIQDLFHNTWLARHSQPQYISSVSSNMSMLEKFGIKAKPEQCATHIPEPISK